PIYPGGEMGFALSRARTVGVVRLPAAAANLRQVHRPPPALSGGGGPRGRPVQADWGGAMQDALIPCHPFGCLMPPLAPARVRRGDSPVPSGGFPPFARRLL